MAKARQCDRCLEYYTQNIIKGIERCSLRSLSFISINAEDGNSDYDMDLCDDCFEALHIFLNKKNEKGELTNGK